MSSSGFNWRRGSSSWTIQCVAILVVLELMIGSSDAFVGQQSFLLPKPNSGNGHGHGNGNGNGYENGHVNYDHSTVSRMHSYAASLSRSRQSHALLISTPRNQRRTRSCLISKISSNDDGDDGDDHDHEHTSQSNNDVTNSISSNEHGHEHGHEHEESKISSVRAPPNSYYYVIYHIIH
jgi:hypothetical protein